MPTSADALIQIEQGQALVAFAAMTDSGDQRTFNPADDVMSAYPGKEPVVRPNGIVTGRDLVSVADSGSNDVVDVAAFTAYSGGVLYSVAADADFSITRPATDVAKVCSITMTDAGALAEVAGTDGSDANFSETRGAAGGPPEIPADSVEIAQVRMTSATAAAIASTEIFQVVGTHVERYDFPVWTVNNIGDGDAADASAEINAFIKFVSALPAIHASGAAKKVYIQYYTPIFADISRSVDFKAAETSHSVSSTQIYGGSIAAASETLGQGGFTAYLEDGITDALVRDKNRTLTVKYFPDRNKEPFALTQGKIGLSRTWSPSDQNMAEVTITSEVATAEFSA